VALRKDMWALVRRLRDEGITIVLTTHYIEEAEEMADRIGFISHGRLMRVQDKHSLMQQLGKKQLTLTLAQPLAELPEALHDFNAKLSADGLELTCVYGHSAENDSTQHFLQTVHALGVRYQDIHTRQSSLEDIFVQLMQKGGTSP